MAFDASAVPAAIQKSHRLVVWRYEERDGKRTKVPYRPACPMARAAVNRPDTWGQYAAALQAVVRGQADGIGVVLGDGRAGVDLDHCRDAESGHLEPWAARIIRELDSYTEVSPSGTGIHVLIRGTLPGGRRRQGPVEMYSDGRFFTVTGWHVATTPGEIRERTAALAMLHRRIFPPVTPPQPLRPPRAVSAVASDATLLAKARAARNGGKFATLWDGDTAAYPSQSEADQALCNLLAYWTNGDAPRVDALFRVSGLMRPKWDRRRGERTYGECTVAMACAGVPRHAGVAGPWAAMREAGA